MWAEEVHPALLPKTKESGIIMVADFVDKYNGCLGSTIEEQAQHPTTGKSGADKEGYWTDGKCMAQFKNACDIVELTISTLSPFVFDQSGCHTKYDDHAPLHKG